MTKKMTVPVSERALIQRINRAEDEMLKMTRGGRAKQDLGRHYVIGIRRNVVHQMDIDLAALARKLGVLREYEHVQAPHD
jgi:hypothetical protein